MSPSRVTRDANIVDRIKKEKADSLAHGGAEEEEEEDVSETAYGGMYNSDEEAERHRKELAKSRRKSESLHSESPRITVSGESHRTVTKAPKPDLTMELRVARKQYEESRVDRRVEAEKKKTNAHLDKLKRCEDAMLKVKLDREKNEGMRIAEAYVWVVYEFKRSALVLHGLIIK